MTETTLEPSLTPEEELLVEELASLYSSKRPSLEQVITFVDSMVKEEIAPGGKLFGLVHSLKFRLKDVDHLRRKLRRKILEGKASQTLYEVSRDNLFVKINDLAGYRLMHLHPRQMGKIHPAMLDMFREHHCDLVEEPEARVWDLESKAYFESIGLKTKPHEEKLYSSTHYVIFSNRTSKLTCEIQVRTLADEVWGEVDHSINYPEKHESVACREQIKTLAHVTTSCNRLVDAIFESDAEWKTL